MQVYANFKPVIGLGCQPHHSKSFAMRILFSSTWTIKTKAIVANAWSSCSYGVMLHAYYAVQGTFNLDWLSESCGAVLSCSSNYCTLQDGSNFWACWRNPELWLWSETFLLRCLLYHFLEIKKFIGTWKYKICFHFAQIIRWRQMLYLMRGKAVQRIKRFQKMPLEFLED